MEYDLKLTCLLKKVSLFMIKKIIMAVLKKRSQSLEGSFESEDGGQTKGHLIPFAFSASRRVVDLNWASPRAWKMSPNCHKSDS